MTLADRIAKMYIAAGRLLGKRLYGVGQEDQYFSFSERYGSNKTTAHLDSYKGIVYACVSAISEEVGNYEPRLFRQKGDATEDIGPHEFLDLLNNPQPDEETGIDRFQLFEATQAFIELTGECFWYMLRGQTTRKPRAIYLLRPDRMGLVIDDAGKVTGYLLRQQGKESIPFEVEEILHFKMFNPKNPYRGLGTIQAGGDYIDTDEFTTTFTKNFFKNNAGVNGVLTLRGQVAKEAFQKFARRWREKYEGVDNAGKTALLRESDATFTKVGLGLNELDMQALRKMTKEDVFLMFRVPKALVGISDETGLGRASVEVLEYIFTKRVIEPKMNRLDAVLQKAVRRYYKEQKLTLRHADIVPADKEFDLKERIAATDVWRTRNEVRDEDGLDAVPGGDELRAPLASAPLSLDVFSDGSDNASAGIKIIRRTVKQEVSPEEKERMEWQRKENFRLSLVANQRKFSTKFNGKLKTVLEAQRKEIVGRINPKALKDLSGFLFDPQDADKTVSDALEPIQTALFNSAGKLALQFAGDDENDFVMTEAQRTFVRESLGQMAHNFNGETLKALEKTLSEGIEAGESLAKLATRVGEVYDGAKGYRALRLARTETIKASNQAANFAYKQTGYVKYKVWFANPGADEICAELDGKIVGLDDNFVEFGDSVETEEGGKFVADYEAIETPPIHPNCRCTIIPSRG